MRPRYAELFTRMQDPDPLIAQAAFDAILFDRTAAIPDLVEVYHHSTTDHALRFLCVQLLGFSGSGDAVPTLVRALDDQHAAVRAEACRSLEDLGRVAWVAVEAVRRLEADADAEVRIAAMEALVSLEAVDPVIRGAYPRPSTVPVGERVVEITLDSPARALSADEVRAIECNLRELTGSFDITVVGTRPGSIRVRLEASAEVADTLRRIFESGDLRTLLGMRVIDVVVDPDGAASDAGPDTGGLPGRRVGASGLDPGAPASTEIENGTEILTPEGPPREALMLFFRDAFTPRELLAWIECGPQGRETASELPSTDVPPATFAVEAVTLLERRGLIGPALFRSLHAARPSRKHQIDRIAATWRC